MFVGEVIRLPKSIKRKVIAELYEMRGRCADAEEGDILRRERYSSWETKKFWSVLIFIFLSLLSLLLANSTGSMHLQYSLNRSTNALADKPFQLALGSSLFSEFLEQVRNSDIPSYSMSHYQIKVLLLILLTNSTGKMLPK